MVVRSLSSDPFSSSSSSSSSKSSSPARNNPERPFWNKLLSSDISLPKVLAKCDGFVSESALPLCMACASAWAEKMINNYYINLFTLFKISVKNPQYQIAVTVTSFCELTNRKVKNHFLLGLQIWIICTYNIICIEVGVYQFALLKPSFCWNIDSNN